MVGMAMDGISQIFTAEKHANALQVNTITMGRVPPVQQDISVLQLELTHATSVVLGHTAELVLGDAQDA